MFIENKKELSTTNERKIILELIETGIKKVLPKNIIKNSISIKKNKLQVNNQSFEFKRIFVIGGGKASGLMAKAIEEKIDIKNITAGIINTNKIIKTKKIKINKAGHPTPTIEGVKGVKEMLALKKKYNITKEDIILCLISGGGSSLLPSPVKRITLKDKQKITKLLIESGATIHEINKVRKHISQIKGGRLAKHFAPAKIISLIISDVIGNNLDVIASGPTAPDPSTFTESLEIIKKYQIKASEEIINYLKRGQKGKEKETPKKIENAHNIIIGDNKLCLNAIKEKAKILGLKPLIITSKQTGETNEVANHYVKRIENNKYKEHNLLLIGGETTPTLPKSHGKGGRNIHYITTTIQNLNLKKWTAASVGTDGCDFIEGIAGGIADQDSKKELGEIDSYLLKFDSYNLLKKGNYILKSQGTGTNVADIMIYLIDKE